MKYRIAILDDNKEELKKLTEIVLDCASPDAQVKPFHDPGDLLISINTHGYYDIIFMDIIMEKGNAIDCILLFKILKQMNHNAVIIFLSNYNFCHEIVNCEPFRYIIKPYEKETIVKTFYDACIAVSEISDIFFKYSFNKKKYAINLNDVMYFQSEGRYVYIHFANAPSVKFIDTINNSEKKVKKIYLYITRIHNRTLVNCAHIKRYEGNRVILINEEPLSVSSRYKKQFEYIFYLYKNKC